MTDKWKERFEKVILGAASSLFVVIITTILKGEKLNGLVRLAGLFNVLRGGVPLWLFLIVLLVAVFAITSRVRNIAPKGTLHVVWEPDTSGWAKGTVAGRPAMQLILWGLFTNSDPRIHLIISQVYLEGTKSTVGLLEPVIIPPHSSVRKDLLAFVEPVIAKEGRPYHGRLILVDQFNRKHKVPIEVKNF